MTAIDPRPALAALAARLAPAAEALAAAYAQDLNPEPPPPDERARADHHRAGRAQLAHLRQLLAVIDWAGAHLPEPEPAPEPEPEPEPEEEPWEPPPQVELDYDGSEDEFHYGGVSWIGSQDTPGFRAWLEDLERRRGPLPLDKSRPDCLTDCIVSGRKFTGRMMTPEFRAWHERQERRTDASIARCLERVRSPEHDKT